MTKVKSLITNSLLTLTLVLLILATAFLINDAQVADAAAQIPTPNQVVYLQLDDAPPVRDISLQQIAPLQ